MINRIRHVLPAFVLLIAATNANAQVTYHYESLNYNVFDQTNPAFAYNASERMNAWFTIPGAIAPNTGQDFAGMLVTWRADDGFQPQFGGTGIVGLFEPDTYNPGFPTLLSYFYLHADGSGNIDSWDFDGLNAPHAGTVRSNYPNFSDQIGQTFVHDYVYSRPGLSGVEDLARAGVDNVGKWTVDSAIVTPEPASLVLMASGLFAVGLSARKKSFRR